MRMDEDERLDTLRAYQLVGDGKLKLDPTPPAPPLTGAQEQNELERYMPIDVDLLHCPFCGEKAGMTNVRMSGHSFSVGCVNEFGCWRPRTGYYDTQEAAITAWNKRYQFDLLVPAAPSSATQSDICACGHSLDAHATGGCAHTLPAKTEKGTGRSLIQMCQCKGFESAPQSASVEQLTKAVVSDWSDAALFAHPAWSERRMPKFQALVTALITAVQAEALPERIEAHATLTQTIYDQAERIQALEQRLIATGVDPVQIP